MGNAIRVGECIASAGRSARWWGDPPRAWGWPLAVVAAMFASGPVVAATASDRAPAVLEGSAPADDLAIWEQILLELLRQLYEDLGGDPAELDQEPVAALEQVAERYRAGGIPPDMPPAARDQMLADIYRCREHMMSPDSTIDPGTTQWFLGVLADMEAELLKAPFRDRHQFEG